MSRAQRAAVLALTLLSATQRPAPARGAPAAADAPTRATAAVTHPPQSRAGVMRAPSGPPLAGPVAVASGASAGEEPAQGAAPGASDPLVSNGLGSPLCRGVLGPGEMSALSAGHCETSGFVAAPAPTGDYGLDVHIDTGFLGLSQGTVAAAVQDIVVAPIWMGVVWAVHALVVMLEWAFTIDLIDSAAAGGVGAALREMQAAITAPWLALVLAAAAVLAAYNGLIRRRVGDTVGKALITGAMMAGGLWVIADPAATVGALDAFANEASLGTLAVAARGSPATPGRTLGESMSSVYAFAVEGPWCYLEFGDVAWCRDTARLDPRLRVAGLKIAAAELALIGCKPGLLAPSGCAGAQSAQAQGLDRSARLLRGAQNNGDVFLALPANGPDRNSINQQGSLLRTLCESSEATSCRGPTAAQAQFRTGGGTLPRLGGLLLIGAGVLGLLLLFGFIGLRLLAAALFSLLYLLLAPAMVLAPALGEAGRAAFRRWVAQLLGAVVSKLLFAFLLGVVLAVVGILSRLTALGWWTQWLLMSAFWWGAFSRRHQALSLAGGAVGAEVREPRPVWRRVNDALEPRRKVSETMHRRKEKKRGRPAPEVDRARMPGHHAPASGGGSAHRNHTSPAARRDERGDEGHPPRGHADSGVDTVAVGAGEPAAGTGGRERDARDLQVAAGTMATERAAHRTAADSAADGAVQGAAAGGAAASGAAASGAAAGGEASEAAERGQATSAREDLTARRVQLDRVHAEHARAAARGDTRRAAELAARATGNADADAVLMAARGAPERMDPERRGSAGEARGAVPARRAEQQEIGARSDSAEDRPAVGTPPRERPAASGRGFEEEKESPVMRDARAVAEQRKRQLGFDRD